MGVWKQMPKEYEFLAKGPKDLTKEDNFVPRMPRDPANSKHRMSMIGVRAPMGGPRSGGTQGGVRISSLLSAVAASDLTGLELQDSENDS